MQYNPDIFRAYDIRGIYGEEFDADFAYKLGIALVDFLQAKKIVVAHENRASSKEIKEQLIKGITFAGCDVIDIGVTSSPLFYFGVRHENADGGVMITASHLTDEYNGFKITRKDAKIVGGDNTDFEQLKQRISQGRREIEINEGAITTNEITDAYVNEIMSKSGITPDLMSIKVKLDANQTVTDEVGALLVKLGVKIVFDNPDIIFSFDADGDRFMVRNAQGDKYRGDLIGGMLAAHYFVGKKFVYDGKYSHHIIEYLQNEKQVQTIVSKTGHAFIKAKMEEHDADFGAEYSSHHMYKTMSYGESPATSVVLLLYLLHKTGKTIDELIEPMNKWIHSGEIQVSLAGLSKDLKVILSEIKAKYPDGQLDEMDGVSIRTDSWRLLVRGSSTNPVMYYMVEAATQEQMEQMKSEIEAIIGTTGENHFDK